MASEFIDYILSPRAIRERTEKIFMEAQKGGTHFIYNADKLTGVVQLVCDVIRQKYPDLKIPYHSRWGHFNVGGVDRLERFQKSLGNVDPIEKARCQFDLVITSVLLDAGAGPQWKYQPIGEADVVSRSEGLAVASLDMFLGGEFAVDERCRADAERLKKITAEDIRQGFQVSEQNPLVGLEGRAQLMSALGACIEEHTDFFRGGRPGGMVDYLEAHFGKTIDAADILKTVLLSLGDIWPGRLSAEGRNLGDVWSHPLLGSGTDSYVPFHKLSQWLTYSLIEPLEEAGFAIKDLNQLTGLAEYRNGGLLLDSGLIQLRDPQLAKEVHRPESELVIEWRALTVYLLDQLAKGIRESFGFSEEEFPLAKALEGGTWWAGRKLAYQNREGGTPPLTLDSDGTVF